MIKDSFYWRQRYKQVIAKIYEATGDAVSISMDEIFKVLRIDPKGLSYINSFNITNAFVRIWNDLHQNFPLKIIEKLDNAPADVNWTPKPIGFGKGKSDPYVFPEVIFHYGEEAREYVRNQVREMIEKEGIKQHNVERFMKKFDDLDLLKNYITQVIKVFDMKQEVLQDWQDVIEKYPYNIYEDEKEPYKDMWSAEDDPRANIPSDMSEEELEELRKKHPGMWTFNRIKQILNNKDKVEQYKTAVYLAQNYNIILDLK